MKYITRIIKTISFSLVLLLMCSIASAKVVIAIDAGHGGKDPGAVGQKKNYEKVITLSIAKKLKNLIDQDSELNAVLTRSNDEFISVFQRSEIARKHKADLLISIHADAAPNKNAKGASVWVLSIKRVDTELGRWIEQNEKQSELLGGAGDVLSEENNPFLSQAILDLQFSNSQRVGYGLAESVLKEMSTVVPLHKSEPEYASLGVLRSPDIPSILIEVGFISNLSEEKLLKTSAHQNKIAKAIYHGIKQYVKRNPINKEQH